MRAKPNDSSVRGIVFVSLAILVVAAIACSGGVSQPPETGSPESPLMVRERHVRLEGQSNFRDLGGYRAADGRTVKWGEIFRTGELGQLTDGDVAVLEDLGIRTVVNFLLPEEIVKHGPDRLPAGTREVMAAITSERAVAMTRHAHASIVRADFRAIPPELNPEFHRMLVDDGAEQYATLLRELADPAKRPLAFHCSHGVHRTGTATAIVLSVLGVPWETIREEYLVSNELRREEIVHELAAIRQVAAERQGVLPEDVDMTNVEAFYVLDGAYIDGTLERAIEEHGSMDAYVREAIGLTDDEIEHLRSELLEPEHG